MTQTFSGGKHVPGHKELSRDKAVRNAVLPKTVFIPLSQHTGAPCAPLVKPGDMVKAGQKIGESQSFISAPVHASISGTVRAVEEFNHPVLGRALSVIIDSDGKDEPAFSSPDEKTVGSLSREELISIIKDAGIVGLGGAAFPTHVKLSPPHPVDTLIVNAAECEPYLTCDFRLMLERVNDILQGVLLVKKILSVNRVFIGVESDKAEATRLLRNKIVQLKLDIEVVPLKTKYPQGAEKQLIQAITGREVPPGKLPFDANVVVNNVGTMLAVYEAVYQGSPLFQRVLTVTGSIVREPANLLVRVGTLFSELIEQCGGLTEPAGKLIMGGPMMGLAQSALDVPVIKGTSGILVLSKEQARQTEESACIRCGRCVEACPVNLLPSALSVCGEARRFDLAEEYNPFDCIECGTCTYLCPARRRIVEYIRLIKSVLKR